jgi:putative membrane protein
MRLILRIILNAIALWITDLILPAKLSFLILAVIFGLVNALICPIVKFFSLPITIVTLGLFTLVINVAMLALTSWLAGSIMATEGNLLSQAWWVFIGAIIISLVSMVLNWFLPDKKD